MTYKPLRDYGLIGDMRTAALVGRDGSIDWCCFPRFDGPSVFAALLDARRGGRWSVAPPRGASGGAQAYEPGTNVLRTRFRSADVIDFMPVYRPRADVPLEIHRCVLATGAGAEIEVRFHPCFDYARSRTVFSPRRHGLLATDALGSYGELDAYVDYLKRVCRQRTEALQIMYGVGGELELPEEVLDHLEGYRSSSPVRIGNAAADQLQLDVYGELMDSLHIWRRPDASAWEVRGPPRHFVFSKVMCWVALDRAIRAAEELGHPFGLLYRYRGDDGLPGGEGTFCVNTFQLAQALALAGRRKRAAEVFENVLGYASPLGLTSEEIDPDTGELLGNDPQAYSPIGLIDAAHVIERTRRERAAASALLPDD